MNLLAQQISLPISLPYVSLYLCTEIFKFFTLNNFLVYFRLFSLYLAHSNSGNKYCLVKVSD